MYFLNTDQAKHMHTKKNNFENTNTVELPEQKFGILNCTVTRKKLIYRI